MRNKAADRLVLAGVIIHMIQWFTLLRLFFQIENKFGHFTIYNPNVVNGTMQSFSFSDMMRSLLYSGTMRNTLLFFMFAALLIYLWLNAVFIILEIISYVMIRRNRYSLWGYVPAAMGVKLAVMDLAAVPFLMAGLMLMKQKKESGAETEETGRRRRRVPIRKQTRLIRRKTSF
ncbi:hypothetical protein J7E26_13350 [Bacillus sp. ISL-51]|uniref:hypothetical protein n=1 Tax=Bacteria TaxID=2 RepID=UPI001BE8BFF5|nr:MULTISPECIES: hypothetical protein [Bacteria]MBT2574929.1 hypothetical protein [Bacillus sp. ISL-51]MBT2634171.1 hypothetical protein [Bacillus sp. ISL-26]MBT2713736.1 hypothetical protein [Pseudomonas sp. ISL-88]